MKPNKTFMGWRLKFISFWSTDCFIRTGALPSTLEIFFCNNLVKLGVHCLPFMQYLLILWHTSLTCTCKSSMTFCCYHYDRNFVQQFMDFPKPLIAAVNGPAEGISITIMGLFGLIYAWDKATFHTPFMELGQSPEGCSSFMFPRIMGPAKVHCLASNFCWNLCISCWVEEHILSYCFNCEITPWILLLL